MILIKVLFLNFDNNRLGKFMKNPFDTPEREAFRAQLKAFVDKEIKPYVNDWDEEGKIPWDLHQKAGALGVWGFGTVSYTHLTLPTNREV